MQQEMTWYFDNIFLNGRRSIYPTGHPDSLGWFRSCIRPETKGGPVPHSTIISLLPCFFDLSVTKTPNSFHNSVFQSFPTLYTLVRIKEILELFHEKIRW